MKQKIKKEVEVEVSMCNICRQEITKDPFNKERVQIVRNLFSTADFDAHELCINKVIKETFSKYFESLLTNH